MIIITKFKNRKKIPWKEKTAHQKAVFAGSIAGFGLIGFGITGFAITSLLHTSESFVIPNTSGKTFTIDIGGTVEGIEVVQGTEQTVAPTIQNTGTEKMYMFIRFDVATVYSDDQSKNVYTFTPSDESAAEWIEVDNGEEGQIIYCYGSAGSPATVNSQDSVTLSGTLKLDVSGIEFLNLSDENLSVTVTGCALSEEATSVNANELYAEYITAGGE